MFQAFLQDLQYTLSFVDFITPKSIIAQTTFQFHHDLIVLMTFILGVILYFLVSLFTLFGAPSTQGLHKGYYGFTYFKHKGLLIEIVWTLVPALLLVGIAIPSFALLYSTGFYSEPEFTFKAVGNQWYWKYEYTLPSKKESASAEAFLVTAEHPATPLARLLAPSLLVPVPIHTSIRALVTSRDVLHSWSVPALALKLDACPGRLNEGFVFITMAGAIYGTCSEICGVNHAFMPTGLYALHRAYFF